MDALLLTAARVGERLRTRGETVAVGESSAGGLVAAALLAQPGASAFFLGGGVVYTRQARLGLLGIGPDEMAGLRPSTEAYALLLARRLQQRLGSSWGLAETGAAGPSGNSYGDAPGHSCIAIVGPIETARTIETRSTDRWRNMQAFAAGALGLLAEHL